MVGICVVLTMRFMLAGHLLFFASPKKSKQKKGDPDVQVWLRQTSLTTHPFFGACELAALRASSNKRTLFPEKRMRLFDDARSAASSHALRASSNKRTLFPEKRMLRSAGRRGEGSSINPMR